MPAPLAWFVSSLLNLSTPLSLSLSLSLSFLSLRYIGWPSDWDEVLPWPNPRLARNFTYTKRVKAWVRDRGNERYPALATIRMPQPGSRHAREALSLEAKVYIEYFPPGPPDIEEGNLASWVAAKTVSGWEALSEASALKILKNKTDNILMKRQSMGTERVEKIKKSAEESYDRLSRSIRASRDEVHVLPRNPFERGSLLKQCYRVERGGGEAVCGRVFTGEIKIINVTVSTKAKKSRQLPQRKQARPHVSRPEPPSPPDVVAVSAPPFPLGVSSIPGTNSFASYVTLSGNRFALGKFPSAIQAAICHDHAFGRVLKKAGKTGGNFNFTATGGRPSGCHCAITTAGLVTCARCTNSISNNGGGEVNASIATAAAAAAAAAQPRRRAKKTAKATKAALP